jgi:hypothetical protein
MSGFGVAPSYCTPQLTPAGSAAWRYSLVLTPTLPLRPPPLPPTPQPAMSSDRLPMLVALEADLAAHLPIRTHRTLLHGAFESTFTGTDAVAHVTGRRLAADVPAAVGLLNELVAAGLCTHARDGRQPFKVRGTGGGSWLVGRPAGIASAHRGLRSCRERRALCSMAAVRWHARYRMLAEFPAAGPRPHAPALQGHADLAVARYAMWPLA